MRNCIRVFIIIAAGALTGCTIIGDRSWRPSSQTTLWAETSTPPATTRPSEVEIFSAAQNLPNGTLYLYDASDERLLYTGLVQLNETLRLYSNRALVIPAVATTNPVNADSNWDRNVVASYPSGHHIKAYVMRTFQGMQIR